MRRMLAGLVVLAATLLLSGCYVAPGYGYVRGGAVEGPAYYGRSASGYAVAPLAGGYDDGYYGGFGYYGCCYAPPVRVGGVWYRGARGAYRDGYYRGRGHAWQAPYAGYGRNGRYPGHRPPPTAPRHDAGRRNPGGWTQRRDGNRQ